MGCLQKEGNSNYASVNPQNFRLVFIPTLALSLKLPPINPQSLWISHYGCWKASFRHPISTSRDPISAEHLNKQSDPWPSTRWLLMNSGRIYVRIPEVLRLHVLQYSHDIPCRTFGQTKTLHQVGCTTIGRTSSLCQRYCKSCTICSMQAVHHKPYRLLKQLLILVKPGFNLMDFIEKLLQLPVIPQS